MSINRGLFEISFALGPGSGQQVKCVRCGECSTMAASGTVDLSEPVRWAEAHKCGPRLTNGSMEKAVMAAYTKLIEGRAPFMPITQDEVWEAVDVAFRVAWPELKARAEDRN